MTEQQHGTVQVSTIDLKMMSCLHAYVRSRVSHFQHGYWAGSKIGVSTIDLGCLKMMSCLHAYVRSIFNMDIGQEVR